MTIKYKLTGLVLFFSLVLSSLAGYLIWASLRIDDNAHLLDLSINYLQGISDTRSHISRQAKEAMDYLASGDRQEREEFEDFGQKVLEGFGLWRQAAEEQLTLGVSGEEEDLELRTEIRNIYEKWRYNAAQAMLLVDEGQPQGTVRIYEKNSHSLIDEVLMPGTEDALSDARGEVEDAFHALLLSLGMIPWIAEEGAAQLKGLHASIDGFIAATRLAEGLNRQVKELKDYLLSGEEMQLHHFHDLKRENSLTLKALTAFLIHQDVAAEPDGSARRDDGLLEQFQRMQAVSEESIRLRQQGALEEALRLSNQRLEEILDLELLPLLSRTIGDNTEVIFALTATAERQGVSVVVAALVLIILASLHLIQRIFTTLDLVKEGIEVIGSGDLDHRIGLGSRDELGALASAFDVMADRLQGALNQFAELNSELERRVEERTADLEQTTRELETFSYSVSHDLRSPLCQIGGYAQMLQDELPADDAEVGDLVERIIEGTVRMGRLIDDLLYLAKVSRADLRRQPVDLSVLAEKVVSGLREAEPRRAVEIRIEPGLLAVGDRSLLGVALTNLLGNAWKYTGQKADSLIELGVEEGRAVFFVRDNGAGFDMSDCDLLFLPFQRLHPEGEFSGTGIGLATVQRIIHRHGGRIWAEGIPGQEATFYFTLGEGDG